MEEEEKNGSENNKTDANDKSRQKSQARSISGSSDSEDSATQEKRPRKEMPMLAQYNGFIFPGIPASPPRFVSAEQISQAADVFSNMALAHEIAVNKEFVLQKQESGLEKQVKAIVHKAFWDSFKSQLEEDPPDYSHALTLLSEIKETLLDILLPHQSRLRSQIDESLDLELIKQQVENDALDFHYYAQFILSTMSRLCAPIRDDAIKELTELTDVVAIYKGILETLDLMKLDMANFTIQQMRPQIQQHSVEYERSKFREFQDALKRLSPPVDGLEVTRKWLKHAHETLLALESGKSSSSSTNNTDISSSSILIKAYLDVLHWDKNALFPETLQMDRGRFESLKEQYFTLILSATVLLITYSIVGTSIHGISSLKSQLKDKILLLLADASSCGTEELKIKLESTSLQVVKEVNECLVQHGYSVLDEAKTSQLSSQINEIQSEDHSVRKLIRKRILEFLEELLMSSNPATVKFPAGLSAFFKELSSLAGPFLQLVKHNRSVFSDFYDNIISDLKDIMGQGQDPSSTDINS